MWSSTFTLAIIHNYSRNEWAMALWLRIGQDQNIQNIIVVAKVPTASIEHQFSLELWQLYGSCYCQFIVNP